jgi:hypothetical protein
VEQRPCGVDDRVDLGRNFVKNVSSYAALAEADGQWQLKVVPQFVDVEIVKESPALRAAAPRFRWQ